MIERKRKVSQTEPLPVHPPHFVSLLLFRVDEVYGVMGLIQPYQPYKPHQPHQPV